MKVEPAYGREGDRFRVTGEPSYGREGVNLMKLLSLLLMLIPTTKEHLTFLQFDN